MSLDVMYEDKDKKMGVKTAEDDLFSDVARIIPFGIPTLDIILGGGLYTGKIYEVMGWESSGKSTMALEASKAFSKYWIEQGDKNFLVLWIETESAMDKLRALYMGCDLTNFLFFEAETTEAGFNIMETWLKKCQEKGFHLLIIWDTIAAAPTEAEIAEPKKSKGDKDEEKTAQQYQGGLAEKARIIRYNLRKLTQPLAQTDSIMFVVNQLYHVPQQKKFQGGETERSPGGEGFHFHASVRMKTTKKEDLNKTAPDGQQYSEGILTEVFTHKNKLTLPKQRALIVLKGETGFDKFETLVRYLRTAKLIDMSGSWATIKFPSISKPGTDEKEPVIEYQEIKFQNAKQLQEIADKTPGLEDYMDYLVYQSYSYISPLIKVKIINKLWDYEERFMGKRKTELTEREKEVAIMLHKFNESQDNNREDNK